jgi:radical SAM protein with 4Fe4S-binding SPASM domain
MRRIDYGEYTAVFDRDTNFFLRGDQPNGRPAEFSSKGPELADVHITTYCEWDCRYCYRDSNPDDAVHMPWRDYRDLMKQLSGTVYQVAIGGGSPQHHPDFEKFLQVSRELDIVPTYTSNGQDMLDPRILSATQKYAGAVAVSVHDNEPYVKKVVGELIREGVPTAIHVVLDRDYIGHWTAELRLARLGLGWFGGELPLYSCIFLMHKPVGRGSIDQHPSDAQKQKFMKALTDYRGKVPVGLDSCAAPSFASLPGAKIPKIQAGKQAIDIVTFCDSGCFTVFIGEDFTVKPCSFNETDVYSLNDFSFDEIWRDKFEPYRRKVLAACPDCHNRGVCRGCAILPEINPCGLDARTC